MSNLAIKQALELDIQKPPAKLLLLSLAHAHNKDTGMCCPSIDRLSIETSLGRSTVKRYLKWLEDEELIGIISNYDDNRRQRANTYHLTYLGEGSKQGVQSEGEGSNSEPLEGSGCEPPLKEPKEIPKETSSKSPPQKSSGLLDRFDELWSTFPERHNSSENKALVEFRKLSDEDQVLCLDCAKRYRYDFGKMADQFGQTFEERTQRAPFLSNWIARDDWRKSADLPQNPADDPKVQQAMKTKIPVNRNMHPDLFRACEVVQGKHAPCVDAWAFPREIVEQARGHLNG